VKWTGSVAQAIRVPALQVQSPEFKPQTHQKIKQQKTPVLPKKLNK
jgi:hypothetical protein